jgi:hypothetical protein
LSDLRQTGLFSWRGITLIHVIGRRNSHPGDLQGFRERRGLPERVCGRLFTGLFFPKTCTKPDSPVVVEIGRCNSAKYGHHPGAVYPDLR